MTITTRRMRLDLRFRTIRVADVTRITPRMIRITFRSPELVGFESHGFDDHVKLFFPANPGDPLTPPVANDRGSFDWTGTPPVAREYTPRFFDPAQGELVVDFVVHDHGIASDWAAGAQPGDTLMIGGPRGSFLVEGSGDLHLLAGDATALPAIARRAEELPAGTKVHAVIEVADEAEVQPFATAADLTLTWLFADRGENLSDWLDHLRLPEGETFVFFAAEAGVVGKARTRLPELGLPDSHLKASNYWHKDAAGH